MRTIHKLFHQITVVCACIAGFLVSASPLKGVETQYTPTGGDPDMYNGITAEYPYRTLPATYDLTFDVAVPVRRVVLWMNSDWGGPVNLTAEILGGATIGDTSTIVGPTVYSISGQVPIVIYIPTTTLRHLQIVLTSTHNGNGILSEVEVYSPADDSITSALTLAGTVGTPITPYTITATNSPTSYSATNLPDGLTLDTSTGVISGTPTTSGSAISSITATGPAGSASDNLLFTISLATLPNQLIPTGGESFLFNGNTAEYQPKSLPATYDLSFDAPVEVGRVVFWMPSVWGGPVDITAEIRGGNDINNLTTIVGTAVYQISGPEPVSVTIPTTTLQYLQIVITASHNGNGNLSEVEIYAPANTHIDPTLSPLALVVSGNSTTITTTISDAGFNYSLFYSDSLMAGSWLPVAGNPKAGGGTLSWTDDITSAPKRFYRMSAE